MKQTLLFAMAGVFVLGACAGADREQPDIPSAPVFAKPPQDACSFRDAKNFAGDYFALQADDRYAADQLKSAEALPKGDARNTHFFNIFIRMSTQRAAENVNAAVHGANFILEARDCGSFVISHDDPFILAVLTEALSTGAFAYRAGTEGYVATYDGGSALWTDNWDTWIGGRSVAFGARWATGFGNEALVGTASYRWGVIYDATSPGPHSDGNDDIAAVELCEAGVQYELDAKNRVGRVGSGGGKTVLQEGDIDGFCVGPFPESGGLVSRMLRGIHGFFAPTPLQARRRPPGLGGGIDELSDFLGVNPVAIDVDTVQGVASGPVTDPFIVLIHAATAGGNDFENVPIQLEISGNQGTPAGATLSRVDGCGLPVTNPDPSDLTEVTNELGIAAFCVIVNKSGGYTLRAFHLLTPAFAADTVGTNSFNRTPGQ